MADKQDKVVRMIHKGNGQNSDGLRYVQKNPNDECYTSMADILDELSRWAELGKFKGKRVICPCDWDIVKDSDIYSIEIDYSDGFDVYANSVKKKPKVVYTLFELDGDRLVKERVELKEDEVDEFLRDKLTCNFVRTLTQNAQAWGIKSITASGYNPDLGKGVKFQEVDFSKYDVVITNPPFSQYPAFMKAIVGKVDFCVLAPLVNRLNPSICVPLMEGKAYLGFNIHKDMCFNNPTKDNDYHTKHVAIDWLVSWPEAQQERNRDDFKSGIKYEAYKDEYQPMENLHMKEGANPIKVNSAFPEDYDGWMFGPISILDKLNTDKYEWYGTHCNKYFNSKLQSADNPFACKLTTASVKHKGKNMFCGIVFRKKRS